MELMKPILKKFDNRKCYFYQNYKCALSKSNCILCSTSVKKIEGITENKDYLNFVTTRNSSGRAYTLALISLVLSVVTLLIKLVEIINKPPQ